ncbi:MAG: 16S rRNA (guanine(527)-N(7))-methyltransferase RsmG [Alphaproteobacteria bacterium]|nr:16S rRNA (guanine(527)-N(7))-methyltransferase RsmG [Alphaproteobacteria bacterium]
MKYSPELQDKFEKYVEILRDWQTRANLVAPSTLNDIQHRHIDDSTQLAEYLPRVTIIDLGSGAGFPAVVLAIMGWDVICIESIGKKTKFLEELKKQLNLPNLTVVNDRVENFLATSTLPQNIVFTARAFAPLIKILDYIWVYEKNLSKKSGVSSVGRISATSAYLLKGVNVNQEIATARRKYKFNYELFPSKTGDGFIVEIKNIRKKMGERITGPRPPLSKNV